MILKSVIRTAVSHPEPRSKKFPMIGSARSAGHPRTSSRKNNPVKAVNRGDAEKA